MNISLIIYVSHKIDLLLTTNVLYYIVSSIIVSNSIGRLWEVELNEPNLDDEP